jgi:hypothetical protein
MMNKNLYLLFIIASALSPTVVWADSTQALCEIHPKGEDHASASLACTFSQRQGYITIIREDGVTYDLSPEGDNPGNYYDQNGQKAYRQSGLGGQGQIFRLKDESVYVYWDTSALQPEADEDNWTAPFTTDEYDATTRIRCRAAGDTEFGDCPAGILRMEDGKASVVVMTQMGEKITINFMSDYVNATNREVNARLQGDTWIVTTESGEYYEVPLAAVEGG